MRNGSAGLCPPLIVPSRQFLKPITAKGVASIRRTSIHRRARSFICYRRVMISIPSSTLQSKVDLRARKSLPWISNEADHPGEMKQCEKCEDG
jgi:hypothetical protein